MQMEKEMPAPLSLEPQGIPTYIKTA